MPAFAALLPLIIQGIQAAITAAPKVIAIVKAAKDLIASLFGAKLITKEQQDALHAWVDAQAALAAAGIVPPAWNVDPDPGTPGTVQPTTSTPPKPA